MADASNARHLLMDCENKLDVWRTIFEEHLSYPSTVNTHRIYKDLRNLSLIRHFIYNLNSKNNIPDLFATTIEVIWTHHYFVHYHGTPFDPQIGISNINRELDKLSKMDGIDT